MLCFYIFNRITERLKPTEIQNDKGLILTSLNSSTLQKMFFKLVHSTCNGTLLGSQN